MEKINLENIIKSFFLGLFIGMIVQAYHNTEVLFEYKLMAVLASGSMGFIIGFITEWLTSLLPVRIANSFMYFMINNIIAIIVTTLIMVSLMLVTSDRMRSQEEFMPMIWLVLGVICIANLFDYMMYRRAQKKLNTFKAKL